MRRFKQLFLLFILLILIMGVCGCMSMEKTNKAENIKNLALKYLGENYDDEFTPLVYSDGGWAYDYYTVTFSSKKYSNTVEVKIFEDNGNYYFDDNYFNLVMEEEAEDYFRAIASNYGYNAETKVHFISSVTLSELEPNISFSDYIESSKCIIEVYFISDTDFKSEDIKSILKDIRSAKIMGDFRFIVTNDDGLLSQYSISEMVNEQADSILRELRYSVYENLK